MRARTPRTVAPLRDHIHDVIVLGSKPQMAWIAAQRIIACVAEQSGPGSAELASFHATRDAVCPWPLMPKLP